jgi:hypothetical protein
LGHGLSVYRRNLKRQQCEVERTLVELPGKLPDPAKKGVLEILCQSYNSEEKGLTNEREIRF